MIFSKNSRQIKIYILRLLWYNLRMDLPKDPAVLMSFLNTKLRDGYENLSALCDDLGVDESELLARLGACGLFYTESKNRVEFF